MREGNQRECKIEDSENPFQWVNRQYYSKELSSNKSDLKRSDSSKSDLSQLDLSLSDYCWRYHKSNLLYVPETKDQTIEEGINKAIFKSNKEEFMCLKWSVKSTIEEWKSRIQSDKLCDREFELITKEMKFLTKILELDEQYCKYFQLYKIKFYNSNWF